MKKVLALTLIISMTAATGAYGACSRCETKNNGKHWIERRSRAAKCWIARNVFRLERHNLDQTDEIVCKRCGRTYQRVS